MARNIEIKARLADLGAVRAKATAMASGGPIEIEQDDTFFACADGRLKLRVFAADQGELIFYRRADQAGPKESFYVLSPTTASEALRAVLTQACDQVGRLRKHRTLFLVGRTRVHLDQVEQLGNFLELEVVLQEGEPPEVGVREAHDLMARLGVEPAHLIEGAYLDLLARAGG